VGRLGSGVCVSASFQSFALTAEANVLGGEGNCPGRPAGEMSGEGDMSEGTCPGGMCYAPAVRNRHGKTVAFSTTAAMSH